MDKFTGTARSGTEREGGSEVTIEFKVAPWSQVGAEGEGGSAMVDGVVLALPVGTSLPLGGGPPYNGTVVAFGGVDSFGR